MSKIFKDNADAPIIAFDFDGTLNNENIFPAIGEPRRYAKEVVNYLYDIGVRVIIWTCRDVSKDKSHDDIAPMKEWLDKHGFKYHSINSCIEHAPFHYEARKIYAHMYVDDKAFGWTNTSGVMLVVLGTFLINVMGYDPQNALKIISEIQANSIGDRIREIITDEFKRRATDESGRN